MVRPLPGGVTNASDTAKHLEQLKGGRFPIEVLVRGKDAAENEKLWVTITEKIKAAGVSFLSAHTEAIFARRVVA